MGAHGGTTAVGDDGLFRGDLSQVVVAAHELKTPLALIRQLSLELDQPMLGDDERRAISQHIVAASERALRLTSNLTRAQRLSDELFPAEPLNVNVLCEAMCREIAPLYRASDRQLKFRSRLRLPLAAANRDLLQRIVLGFADNALHYSDEAGVVELYAQLVRSRRAIRIGVRDHGPALPVAVLRAAASSHQPASRLHTRPESSGLGLSIAHRFAEAMGARIGAIRHRDGASFYVEVPISKQLSLL